VNRYKKYSDYIARYYFFGLVIVTKHQVLFVFS
jgi:hypothetical protein